MYFDDSKELTGHTQTHGYGNEYYKTSFSYYPVEGDLKKERRPPYTFSSGAVYEGEWKGSVREGWGTQIWPDGAKYEGNLI